MLLKLVKPEYIRSGLKGRPITRDLDWGIPVPLPEWDTKCPMYSALRAIDLLKVLLAPFVPFSAERVHRALGYEYPLFGAQQIVTYAERERTHEALVYDPTQGHGALGTDRHDARTTARAAETSVQKARGDCGRRRVTLLDGL